ncbi:hypothetical protein ATJ88_0292 [Isoptericola jiangsuensis]|uniref:Uncharacterized protein n=1 Tax=Isoptericola jiangsuensis TaxID=548579 RepID=A0A2A9ETN8_9MICO|nr:hypothetical protein ATJ88_0292 [Isoptericola jiangsuensis]
MTSLPHAGAAVLVTAAPVASPYLGPHLHGMGS